MNNPRVPMNLWGRDHWSTLAYIETRCVDHRGEIRPANMRTNTGRHPLFGARGLGPGDGSKYPTRCNDGSELSDHDDWDCLNDMRLAGLIVIVRPRAAELWDVPVGSRGSIKYQGRVPSSELAVKVKLTKLGNQVAGALRAHLAEKYNYATFSPSFAPAITS